MGSSSSKPAGDAAAPAPSSFGVHTTAEEVVAAFPGSGAGKVALITGANSGLGLETAKALAKAGAAVVVTARSAAKASEAAAQVKAAVPGAQVDTMELRLDDLAQTAAAAAAYVASGRPLHIAICNAGIMAVPYATTKDGFESQFAVDHLGHFVLVNGLMPTLQRCAPARVVTLASVAHYIFAPLAGLDAAFLNAGDPKGKGPYTGAAAASYHPWTAYGAAKLANVLHAYELNNRYASASGSASGGVVGVSVHPGVIRETNLFNDVGVGSMIGMLTVARSFASLRGDDSKTIAQGAATSVFAALAPLEGSAAAAAAGAPGVVRPGAYHFDCRVATTKLHERAYDDAQAAALWEASDRLAAGVIGAAATAAAGSGGGAAAGVGDAAATSASATAATTAGSGASAAESQPAAAPVAATA